jgi:hypothetical protein
MWTYDELILEMAYKKGPRSRTSSRLEQDQGLI